METHAYGPNEASWFDLLELDYPNLRAGITWSLQRGDADEALEGLVHFWPLWTRRGYYQEPTEWFNQVLAMAHTDTALYARTLVSAAVLARFRGSFDQVRPLLTRGLALAQATGDHRQIESALRELGVAALHVGNAAQSIEYLEQALEVNRKFGDPSRSAEPLYWLAEARMRNGERAKAQLHWEAGLRLARNRNDAFFIGWGLGGLSELMQAEGQFQEAEKFSRESLAVKLDIQDKVGVVFTLETLANIAAAQGRIQRAAKLLGVADHWREVLQAAVSPAYRTQLEIKLAHVREQFAPDTFIATWEAGRVMTWDQAIEYARSDEPELPV